MKDAESGKTDWFKEKPTIKIEPEFGDQITIKVPARPRIGKKHATQLSMYITGMQEISVSVVSHADDCVSDVSRQYQSFFLDGDSARTLGEWLMKHTRRTEFEVI